MELWRDVVNYEGFYEVSNTGKIRSVDRYVNNRLFKGKELSLNFLDKGGYKLVTLNKEGTKKSFLVHRLVAIAFIENKSNHSTVNHLDGNKINNHIDNLEWCSLEDNVKHAWKTGLTPSSINSGESNNRSKLTENDVHIIRKTYVPRSRINGSKALSEQFGVTQKTILRIINRELWKNL